VRAALVLGVGGVVLLALYWLLRPPIGFAWLALALLPAILGLACLSLARWNWTRLRRHGLRGDRPAAAALVLGLVAVVVGAPSFLFAVWVLVLILVGGNA
jgi:uncharacterized membrane protein